MVNLQGVKLVLQLAQPVQYLVHLLLVMLRFTIVTYIAAGHLLHGTAAFNSLQVKQVNLLEAPDRAS